MQRILVIDDERAVTELIKTKLERSGFVVYTAYDGLEGLDVLEKVKPDLIVLDILMPRMDGFQFYKKIKERGDVGNIPVLVMTARGAMKDSFEGLGADSFLAKPFEPEELVSQIKRLLGGRGRQRTSQKIALIAGIDQERIEAMRRQLQARGYAVETATDGHQALGKALEIFPDLFILQIDIPGLDAENVLRILSSYPGGDEIPVVAYSPLQTKEEIARSPWGRFVADVHKDKSRDREIPLKVIDKFDADSFLDKIKDFL